MKSIRLLALLAAFVAPALAALLSARTALAVGEQTGRVTGVVTNSADGKPLEAVQLEAKSSALLGETTSTFTDAQGRFDLPNLPPGDYLLTFSYPGTVPTQRKVTVRQGETVRLSVPYGVEETRIGTLDVVAERSLTRPDSTHTGTVKDINTANRLPTGRTYQGIAQHVPGVSGGGNPNIKGGASSHNKYLIDGLDVTDPVTGTFSQNLTWDSTASVDVLTGGMDAEYNALGGVINVVTRGGGEKFVATANVLLNHQDLSAKGGYGPAAYEDYQPFNDTPVGPNQSLQAAVNVGGPIISKRLWYAFTYQFDRRESSTIKSAPLGVAPFDIQHPSRVYTGHTMRARLEFAPTDKHRLRLTANTDPATIDNIGQGNSYLGVAEAQQRQGGFFTLLGWEWLGSERFLPEVKLGVSRGSIEYGPQGLLRDGVVDTAGCDKFSSANCKYENDRPRHFNTLDGTFWYQGPPYQLDSRYRVQFEPSLRIRLSQFGQHNIKVGMQGQLIRHTWKYRVPGKYSYSDNNGDAPRLEGGLCDPDNPTPETCVERTKTPDFDTTEQGLGLGFYVQDHWWTPLSWLTVNPGLRFDIGHVTDWNGRTVSTLTGFAPRLGMTADVTRDGQNIFFAFYGRATDPISLSTSAGLSSSEASVETTEEYQETTDPMTGEKTGMWVKAYDSGGPQGVELDPNQKMPHADELTAGFRRAIFANSVASVEYTYKKISNTWTTTEVNKIWDPSGQRVVGYVNPMKPDLEVWRYGTPDDARYYQGLIFSTEGAPSPNWDYGVSYTLSWTWFEATSSNPRLQNFSKGFSSADQRHYIRAYGAYDFHPDFSAGFYFAWQSGAALTKSYFNAHDKGYANPRSPAGTVPDKPNDPSTIAEFRTPSIAQLDLNLTYNVLPRALGYRFELRLDIFNVLNSRQPTGLRTSDNDQFGLVSGRQAPLRVQLGARFVY